MLGFPIRTSSDQRSVGSSPRLIAASYVLHRPLMPRHPPCALKHLRHKKPIENKNQNCTSTPTDTYTHDRSRRRHILRALDARNHYPRIKHHTPPPKPVRQQQPPPRNRGVSHPHTREGSERACCLRTQQCVWQFFTTNAFQPAERLLSYAPAGAAHYRRRRQSQPPSPALLRGWGKPWIRACKWCSLERR